MKKQQNKKVGRRILLGILAAISTYRISSAVDNYKINSILGNLSSNIQQEEKIKASRTRGDIYLENLSPELRNTGNYYEFRGTVFESYLMQATVTGPLALISRAYTLKNPGVSVDKNLAYRASHLFNILNKEKLTNPKEGEINNFISKVPPTPKLFPGEWYQVPIPTSYKSLEEFVRK